MDIYCILYYFKYIYIYIYVYVYMYIYVIYYIYSISSTGPSCKTVYTDEITLYK